MSMTKREQGNKTERLMQEGIFYGQIGINQHFAREYEDWKRGVLFLRNTENLLVDFISLYSYFFYFCLHTPSIYTYRHILNFQTTDLCFYQLRSENVALFTSSKGWNSFDEAFCHSVSPIFPPYPSPGNCSERKRHHR